MVGSGVKPALLLRLKALSRAHSMIYIPRGLLTADLVFLAFQNKPQLNEVEFVLCTFTKIMICLYMSKCRPYTTSIVTSRQGESYAGLR